MKKFKTFSDLQFVIDNRLDLADDKGYKLDFIALLRCSLSDLLQMMRDGNYWYDPTAY